MALKNTLEPAAVAGRLAAWLPGALGVDGPVEVTGVLLPTASGMSSETLLFDAAWNTNGERVQRGLVARVPPSVGLFPDYDIAREAQVMTALAEHSDAPVPAVLAHERTGEVLGAEFLLLERAYGEVPGDDPPFVSGGWVVDLEPEARATMYDSALRALAAIQRLDPAAAGLSALRHGNPDGGVLEQQLIYWREFYAWAAGGRANPLIDAALDRLESTKPADHGPLVVSWGDARFGNLMFGEDHEVTAVLDWEMATLGPPEVDFGYWLFFDRLYSSGIGAPRLTGFPERDVAIARFAELTGRPARDLDWFEAWAALRGAILLLRVGNLMIEHGQLPADAALPYNNPAAHVLGALLDLPVPDGAAEWISGNR
ncbi:MAG: phosphotransferase [Solirubrobacterales bacterium]|nr:phosphotransferase [Solirubrobacterales bacterium]